MKVGEADLSYLQIWDNEGYRTDICCRASQDLVEYVPKMS